MRRSCISLPSMRRDDGARTTALASLGTLYTLGQPIAWEQLYPSGSHCVAAPSYPWQRVHSWLDVGSIIAPPHGADLLQRIPGGTTEAAGLRDRMYQLRWQPASNPSERDGSNRPVEAGSWLILSDGGVAADTLRDRLESHSQTCVLVEPDQDFERLTPNSYRLDPAQPEHFRQLLEDAFGDERPPCRGVVHLWDLLAAPPADTSPESLESATTLGPVSVLHLVQALAMASWSAPPRLWLVTGGAQVPETSETEAEPVSIAQAPVWGMARTIDHEHPELRCTCVDLSAGGGPEEVPEVDALFREVWADDRDGDVALRGSRRYVERLTRYDGPEPAETAAFKEDATYLVTGGLGALGLAVATWMVEHGARHLVLMGRGGASASAQETVDALRAAGTEVTVTQGDVAKADHVASVLESIPESMPPLRGVVHAAGIADDGILPASTSASCGRSWRPRFDGAWNLHALTRDADLDFFVLFSSAAVACWVRPGQAHYAAANAFLDALAWHRRAEGRPALSINWGPWAEVGLVTRSEQQRYFARHGIEAHAGGRRPQALSYCCACRPRRPSSSTSTGRGGSPTCSRRCSRSLALPALGDKPARRRRRPRPGQPHSTTRCAAQHRTSARRLLESYLREQAAGKLGLAPSQPGRRVAPATTSASTRSSQWSCVIRSNATWASSCRSSGCWTDRASRGSPDGSRRAAARQRQARSATQPDGASSQTARVTTAPSNRHGAPSAGSTCSPGCRAFRRCGEERRRRCCASASRAGRCQR